MRAQTSPREGMSISQGGWVRKKSRSGLFWLRRYLSVREGRLLICKKPEQDPKRVLVIERIKVSRSAPERGRSFLFAVETEERERMVFAAETDEMVNRWMTVFLSHPRQTPTVSPKLSRPRSPRSPRRDRAGWVGGLLDAVLAADGVRVAALNGSFLRKASEIAKSLVDARPEAAGLPDSGVFQGIRIRWAGDEEEFKDIGRVVRNLQTIADLNLSEMAPALVCRVDYRGYRAFCMAVDREPIRKVRSGVRAQDEPGVSEQTWETIAAALNVSVARVKEETTVVALGLGELAIVGCSVEATEFSVLARKTVPWRCSEDWSVDDRLTEVVRKLESFQETLLGSDDLNRVLKSNGIPARLLGVVYEQVADGPGNFVRHVILADVLGRIAKRLVRAHWRSSGAPVENLEKWLFENLKDLEFVSSVAMTEYSFESSITALYEFVHNSARPVLRAAIQYHCGFLESPEFRATVPRIKGVLLRALADDLALRESLTEKLFVEYGFYFGKSPTAELRNRALVVSNPADSEEDSEWCDLAAQKTSIAGIAAVKAALAGNAASSTEVGGALVLDHSGERVDLVGEILLKKGAVSTDAIISLLTEFPIKLRLALAVIPRIEAREELVQLVERRIGGKVHPLLLKLYREMLDREIETGSGFKGQVLQRTVEQTQQLFGKGHAETSRAEIEAGHFFLTRGEFEKAVGFLDQARLSSFARGDEAMVEESSVGLGLCLRERGQLEKALEVVKRGMASSKASPSVSGLYLTATLNEELERANEAIMGYEGLIRIGIRDIEVVRGLVRLGLSRSFDIYPDLWLDLKRFISVMPGMTQDEKKLRLETEIEEAEATVASWMDERNIKEAVREFVQEIRTAKSQIKLLAGLFFWANPLGLVVNNSSAKHSDLANQSQNSSRRQSLSLLSSWTRLPPAVPPSV